MKTARYDQCVSGSRPNIRLKSYVVSLRLKQVMQFNFHLNSSEVSTVINRRVTNILKTTVTVKKFIKYKKERVVIKREKIYLIGMMYENKRMNLKKYLHHGPVNPCRKMRNIINNDVSLNQSRQIETLKGIIHIAKLTSCNN